MFAARERQGVVVIVRRERERHVLIGGGEEDYIGRTKKKGS